MERCRRKCAPYSGTAFRLLSNGLSSEPINPIISNISRRACASPRNANLASAVACSADRCHRISDTLPFGSVHPRRCPPGCPAGDSASSSILGRCCGSARDPRDQPTIPRTGDTTSRRTSFDTRDREVPQTAGRIARHRSIAVRHRDRGEVRRRRTIGWGDPGQLERAREGPFLSFIEAGRPRGRRLGVGILTGRLTFSPALSPANSIKPNDFHVYGYRDHTFSYACSSRSLRSTMAPTEHSTASRLNGRQHDLVLKWVLGAK